MDDTDTANRSLLPSAGENGALPSVETLAALIGDTDAPDERTMAIARATHSRLLTRALKAAPTCSSCIHHTVFCRSVPVLHCMHPAIAATKRDVANGHTTISSRHCETEREDGERSSHGHPILCGVQGRLHEPLIQPWLLPVTRALLRKMKAQW